MTKLGGAVLVPTRDAFWTSVRDHTHSFFVGLPRGGHAAVAALGATRPRRTPISAATSSSSGAAHLRWLAAGERVDPRKLRVWAASQGGHATLFRGDDKTADVFHPLDARSPRLHRKLKAVFDPHGVFNYGRFVQ